uniref:RING-type domain-containing protein n=1 Tax=Melanopsichium pennsylvanicum 4 TaxID=1398559 RepID=A0A077RBJ6_9BASI|nr:putative protein [Melanopsichium pennsylvanicum 4]
MDHLAVFDTLAPSSLTRSAPQSTETSHSSSSYPRDKGKSRARDFCDDDFHFTRSRSAESSRLDVFAATDLEHCPDRSQSKSDRKGKTKQQIPDPTPSSYQELSHSNSDDFADGARPARCARLRGLLTSSTAPSRQNESSSVLWSSCHEDASLKRSIRELGSSPSNSPHQLENRLSSRGCPSSASQLLSDEGSRGASTSFPSEPTPSSPGSRSSSRHKKRRSERANLDGNESIQTLAFQPMASVAPSSSEPYTALVEATHVGATLHSRGNDLVSGTRTDVRRASLLVNSSTSGAWSPDSNGPLCVSPESMDVHPRFDRSRHDLSHRRNDFIDDARPIRSSSTIRRRRGFYLRDADLLRNELASDAVTTSDFPSSAASDVSFTSDFTRAVDLRLGSRTESTQSRTSTSSMAAADLGSDQQTLPAQRFAPQLPHVRAGSPLAISFASADHDFHGPYAGYLRRRAQQIRSDQSQDGTSIASSRSVVSDAESRQSLEHPPNRPSGVSRNASADHNPYRSTLRRAPDHARQLLSGPSDPAADAGFISEPIAPLQSHTSQTNHVPHPSQSRGRQDAAADDFDGIRRPFGRQGSRATRRAFRSRPEDGSEIRNPAEAPRQLEHPQYSSSRPGTVRVSHRQSDESQDQGDALPWRRVHFGLRTPSSNPEQRATGASAPRFEPFAGPTTSESRRSSGLPGQRAPSMRSERNDHESALEYLGRLMSHDSILDEWMAGDVHGPLLQMAIESEVLVSNPHLRHLSYAPASTSSMFDHTPPLAFDARNFIADEDWAELNSYEGLIQLSERLGAAEICVPQSLIESLPTCEYAVWGGGSCRSVDEGSVTPLGKGKGKQKMELPITRDTMCPICREDYLDSDVLMSINKCCHAFHADCIKVSAGSPLPLTKSPF